MTETEWWGMEPMPSIEYTQAQKKLMLTLARAAIADKLDIAHPPADISGQEWLQQKAASFVTLKINGELRGCIGMLEAQRTLEQDLRSNSVNAAFHDARFAPLSLGEFHQVQIQISLLTPARPLSVIDEADLLGQLRPNVDGLVLQEGSARATFLPQVWKQLPDAKEFLYHLKRKAGLAGDYWSDTMSFSVYQVIHFGEPAK